MKKFMLRKSQKEKTNFCSFALSLFYNEHIVILTKVEKGYVLLPFLSFIRYATLSIVNNTLGVPKQNQFFISDARNRTSDLFLCMCVVNS